MSIVWRNWLRSPPLSLIRAGQETIIGLRVPPKWLATCLVHWNGVSIACAQADGKWLKCFGPADLVDRLQLSCHFSANPLKNRFSLSDPSSPPSALEPLSPAM